jgi:hypothetical protein
MITSTLICILTQSFIDFSGHKGNTAREFYAHRYDMCKPGSYGIAKTLFLMKGG